MRSRFKNLYQCQDRNSKAFSRIVEIYMIVYLLNLKGELMSRLSLIKRRGVLKRVLSLVKGWTLIPQRRRTKTALKNLSNSETALISTNQPSSSQHLNLLSKKQINLLENTWKRMWDSAKKSNKESRQCIPPWNNNKGEKKLHLRGKGGKEKDLKNIFRTARILIMVEINNNFRGMYNMLIL